jgi:hypothetical protein
MAVESQADQPQKGLTREDVLIMFQETARRFQETDKKFRETDRKFQESKAEHDRIIVEMDKRSQETEKKFQESKAEHDRMIAAAEKRSQELDRAIKQMAARVDRLASNVGGLNRSMGELIETLIAAQLWEKFAAYPYRLKRAYRRVPIYDKQNVSHTEIDILLSDTEWCMAVEVKREVDNKDVDHHLWRMGLIREYPPLEVMGKRMLGAIAGGVVPPDTVAYAHNAGFFVLALTGESVALLDTPAGFVAGEW